MEELYIYKGAKKLRCGFTTGTCAAGAAKAAAEGLLTGNTVKNTEIMTPKGIAARLDIADILTEADRVSCSVVKDGGDDPDVTSGLRIWAAVEKADKGIFITGGPGVGKVTRPGLDRAVGDSAINTVPRKMIELALEEVAERYGYGGGFKVVISVPGGEEIAKKTFNPRMGIVGGISIIGTTGIVEPMSNESIVETVGREENMRKAAGYKVLLLTVGNYSEEFIRLGGTGLEELGVMCSNFIGESIDIAVGMGFEKILLVGHIGKLIKLGSGIMNTHSSCADGRIETLTVCAALAGVDREVLMSFQDCVTVDAALDKLREGAGTVALDRTLDILTGRIERYLQARAGSGVTVGAAVFSFRWGLELKTGCADALLKELIKEKADIDG
ncbi:MAG: cobalamin biosynthesis protein CbiD [Ruminococcus sp.]|nr:cobalamin biosynthesis protein CbiD [Ruminococcus sp.]